MCTDEANDQDESQSEPEAKDYKRELSCSLATLLHAWPAVASQVHHQRDDFRERDDN